MTFLTRAATSFGRAFLSPTARAGAFAAAAAVVGATTVAADTKERSLILCKPDAVQRGLVHKIIGRFEERGYKLVAIRLVTPSEDLARAHYADLKDRPFFPRLTGYLSSSPVVAMVWEGEDIVRQGRKMIGATSPLASEPGTIRGDMSIVVENNIIHGSG